MASFFDLSNSETSSMPKIAPSLRPYLYGQFDQLSQAGDQFPSIAQLPGAVPLLDIPGMTPEQQQTFQLLMAQGQTAPQLQQAQNQLQQLTSGPIGSSPATVAGMKAFQDLTAPSIMGTAARQGNAAGGAAIEAMQQGATFAALPLIQQEITNREAAVGQYGNLQQQQMQSLTQAFEAAGYPREVALQQAQAAYNQAMGGFDIQKQVQLGGPMGLLGNMIGSSGHAIQHQTGQGFLNQGAGILSGLLNMAG